MSEARQKLYELMADWYFMEEDTYTHREVVELLDRIGEAVSECGDNAERYVRDFRARFKPNTARPV